jgi:hypothetical protein
LISVVTLSGLSRSGSRPAFKDPTASLHLVVELKAEHHVGWFSPSTSPVPRFQVDTYENHCKFFHLLNRVQPLTGLFR